MVRFFGSHSDECDLGSGAKDFPLFRIAQKGSGFHLASYSLVSGVRLPECEVDCSPASNGKAQMDGKCTSTVPESHHGLDKNTICQSIKQHLTLAGIEPATFRFIAQHLNHCANRGP